MKSRSIILILVLVLMTGTASAKYNFEFPKLYGGMPQYEFEPLNFNAGCGGAFCSFGRGINDRTDVVGWGQLPVEEGFYMDGRSGLVTILEYPGAEKTRASGINDRGDIVGQYNDPDGSFHAFLRDKKGTYHNIDFPGSVFCTAWGINSRGQIVGDYSLAGEPLGFHAFVRNPNGTYESFDFPAGMIPTGTLRYTRFKDINARGLIVGQYAVAGGDFLVEVHAFLLDKKGNFTVIDYPVVPAGGENFFVSLPLGINDKGVITGGYIFTTLPLPPGGPPEHGYVRSPKGVFTTVDYPGADATEIYKSSESGVLVGGFRVGTESNAFIARPN